LSGYVGPVVAVDCARLGIVDEASPTRDVVVVDPVNGNASTITVTAVAAAAVKQPTLVDTPTQTFSTFCADLGLASETAIAPHDDCLGRRQREAFTLIESQEE
jgi:hypothetical protein